MTLSFNLIDEPWIPVIPRNGPPREVGLRDALVRAHEWHEVYDNSPLVTVALHRLLLAILYRALPARTEEEWDVLWDELWQGGCFPEALIDAYLDRWRDRFDLFSESHPFYQTAGLSIGTVQATADGTSPITRLAHELASGNNATLFDHRYDEASTTMHASHAARLLMAAQAFSMGGGISGDVVLMGNRFKRPNAQHSLLVNGLCVWIEGRTLHETLLLNLVPDDFSSDDLPPWEVSALSAKQTIREANCAVARGRIDLLTWQARLIRLIGESDGGMPVVRKVYCTQGRPVGDIDNVFDPMKSYLRTEERGYQPMKLGRERVGWADYYSLLALVPVQGKRPDAFAHVADRAIDDYSRDSRYRLHAVGLVNDQAKVILWRHDSVFINPRLLGDSAIIETLGELHTETESVGRRLHMASLRLAYLFVVPNADEVDESTSKRLLSIKSRETDVIEAQAIAAGLDPCRSYWSRLEEPFYRLLDELPTDIEGAATRWRETIIREAQRAFAEARLALGTSARALRAGARVNPYFGDRHVATEVTA